MLPVKQGERAVLQRRDMGAERGKGGRNLPWSDTAGRLHGFGACDYVYRVGIQGLS